MLILSTHDVRKALPMKQAVEAMKSAYAALSDGQAEIPLRAHLAVPPHNGTTLFMPAYIGDQDNEALTVKAVSVFPNNPSIDLPVIHAAVIVFDPITGKPSALLEGGTITAIRTGAASGAATDILARKNAHTAAIFGAGVQGRTQLEAVCEVREIKTAWIFDPVAGKSQLLVDELAGHGNIPSDLRVAATPEEAASVAEIICTATISNEPVYPAEAVRPGTHINGVGSYTLEMIENPPQIFNTTNTFVDSVEAVMAEAGEIVAAINQKIIFPAELTELGDVILGKAHGRISDHQITFFKSVGVAVQDAMAAKVALENAKKLGLGQKVEF
jgi:ornithine cyclodeaminase